MDDVVIKTENLENFIEDLQLVFNSLRQYRWKLNPEKCAFGVPAGKLLGFIVSLMKLRCPIFRRVEIIPIWRKMTLAIRLRRASPRRQCNR
jgi:hypothetical protein